MDEFDVYLESTVSMIIYKDSTISVFRNLLAHPINLEDDWRVTLAEIIHPTKVKNITTTDMIYTPKTPYDSTPVTMRGDGASVVLRHEDWSENAEFEEGEYFTIKSVLKKRKGN